MKVRNHPHYATLSPGRGRFEKLLRLRTDGRPAGAHDRTRETTVPVVALLYCCTTTRPRP
jgi:hypothetical protein